MDRFTSDNTARWIDNMASAQYFVRGKFQPPSREAIRSVMDALNGNNTVRVYVKRTKRGPDSPFSVSQIRKMWEAVFDIESATRRLIVLPDAKYRIGKEISIKSGSDALDSSNCSHCFLGFENIHFRIAKVIASLDPKWRQYLGHSDAMLPESVGTQQGGTGIL